LAYSMVPIAPSQTSTRSSRDSRKGFSILVWGNGVMG
jgi:hypothetical protein